MSTRTHELIVFSNRDPVSGASIQSLETPMGISSSSPSIATPSRYTTPPHNTTRHETQTSGDAYLDARVPEKVEHVAKMRRIPVCAVVCGMGWWAKGERVKC